MATLASDSQCEPKQVRNKKTIRILIIQGAGFWILLVIPHYVVQPARPLEWRPFRLSVAKPEPKKSWRRVRANFNWVSKVIHGWIGFASLRSVTDLENSRQSLNQSNAKLKSIATCGNPRFPALQGVCMFVLFWSAVVITRVFSSGFSGFPPFRTCSVTLTCNVLR